MSIFLRRPTGTVIVNWMIKDPREYMSQVEVLSFEEALKKTSNEARFLILGNGFSISWNPKIFSYNSLKDSAEGISTKTKELFQKMNTVDFEEIIKDYEYASSVCGVHEMQNEFDQKATELRKLLIETIAKSHPEVPESLTEEEYEKCILFLSNFKSIYSLNYDMLLYWVLMKDKYRENNKPILKNLTDGFAYNNEEFLNWDGNSFDIHYVHGALHLFEEDEIVKLNYRVTQKKLKDQFVDLIQDKKKFPLFVAEGDKNKKLRRIRNSGYLTRCLNSLQKIGAKTIPNSVFIYGSSLSDNDLHIVQALAKNKCHNFFIGIYGDQNSEPNKRLIKNAMRIKYLRESMRNFSPCNLYFFDSGTAKVWRD